MSQDIRDPLAQRLATIDVGAAADRVAQRALARAAAPLASPHPLLRLRLVFAAIAVMAAGVLGASYFAPHFGQALADAPVIGGPVGAALAPMGLSNVSGHVTALSDSATANGYRVALAGGYADAIRTVLLVEINPPGRSALLARSDAVTLTDQFGHRYDLTAGFANTQSGIEALEFTPLTWPASSVGARLTLALSSLSGPGALDVVPGDWRLHGTIDAGEVVYLSLPAAGQLGGGSMRFTQIALTPNALQATIVTTGALLDQLSDTALAAGKGQPSVQVTLVDAHGTAFAPLSMRTSEETASIVWPRPAPGRYDLTLTYGGSALTRSITVP